MEPSVCAGGKRAFSRQHHSRHCRRFSRPRIAENFPRRGDLEFSECNDSSNCASGRFPPGTIRVNSAYVEEATPANQTFSIPIVFFHGGGHSGTVFRTTPDGREGWFTSFIKRGFKVLVVDGSNRGRAGWDPVKRIGATAPLPVVDLDDVEDTNTYSREAACVAFRQGTVHPNKSKCIFFGGTQFPKADHDHYLAYLNPAYRDPEANALLAANIKALSDEIGPFICLGWSTGGINCAEAMQNDPSTLANVKAFISVEGGDTSTRGCRGDAEDPGCEVEVATKPYLNILGDRNTGVQTSIDWVNTLDELEGGVFHETIFLPDIGIKGNGHVMMAEKNNEEIADVIEQWIRDHVPE